MARGSAAERGDDQPRRLIFLDCETDRRRAHFDGETHLHRLRLAVATKWLWAGDEPTRSTDRAEIERLGPYSCRERRVFRSTEELVDWIDSATSSRFPTWLIAHRASFDCEVGGIFDAVKSRRWRFDLREKATPASLSESEWAESSPGLQVLNDPPTILSLRTSSGHKLIVVDSMNWWPCALADLGRSVGLDKLPMPHAAASEREWVTYCERDVRIVERSVIGLVEWLRAGGFGGLRYTAAGQAMSVFRTKYLSHVLEPHDSTLVRKAERKAYYGGETRVFRVGLVNEWVAQLDANSLYPYAMRSLSVPISVDRSDLGRAWAPELPPCDLSRSIACVWLRQYRSGWPIRLKDRTDYARGSFATWLCGPELVDAVERGIVVGSAGWVEYRCERIFDAYVDTFFARKVSAKERGDSAELLFAKSMLNSLYGKFGQLGVDMIPRTDFYAPVEWGSWVTISTTTRERREFRCLNGQPFELVERRELLRGMPAISAWVAAEGRRIMRLRREIAGRANVIYQATDSLIVTRRGLERLEAAGMIDETALGAMRVQMTAPSAEISGVGDYAIAEIERRVGIKAGARRIGNREYEFPIFDGLRESLFRPPSSTIREQTRRVKLSDDTPTTSVDSRGFTRPVVIEQEIPAALVSFGRGVGRFADRLEE